MLFAFAEPETARNVLLILLGVGYVSYHLRHVWHRRAKVPKPEVRGTGDPEPKVKDLGRGEAETPIVEERGERLDKPRNEPLVTTRVEVKEERNPAAGENLFNRARALPHQEIPDFELDGLYLDLLGESAAAGYAPALAKLGEYAMRRAAWVEAYYWMSLAKRQGMPNLENVMREIRRNWSQDGFPDEDENIHPLFTDEDGSMGRAFLNIDSGHDASGARDFLRANHPEFLL